MKKSILLVIVILLATVSFVVPAQETDDVPVVAILKFGDIDALNLSEQGTIDLFEAYGYEDGDNIEFVLGEAQFDIGLAGDLIDFALQNEADIIIAISTPITLAAQAATADMDDPPIIIFNAVTSPFGAGVAESACDKADHITGSETLSPHDINLPQMLELNPSLERIGVIYNDQEANSVISVGIIEDVAEDIGISVMAQPIETPNTAQATAESMIMSGIDAFYIPTDSTAVAAMPVISSVGDAAGIPVFAADSSQVYNGASVAIGFDYYQEGVDAGRIAVYYLAGDLDIANVAITSQTEVTLAVNLDKAALQNVEISEDFLDTVDFYIEDGESTQDTPALEEMSLEDRMEEDLAFLEARDCRTIDETDD